MNVERDRKHADALESLGFRVITAWECEIRKDLEKVVEEIRGAVLSGHPARLQ